MSNAPEYSVSELSAELKKKIEDGFAYVRVRGELGRVTRAGSGHMYLDLKDERAVLSGVMWKGAASRLSLQPEQGMEVIASGRLTTFPGQSRYQIVIDTLEPAGEGALMALLEARRKALAKEGLFEAVRKKPLPYLPEVIGVVTSPSGAVIRDILHRLRDRFPRRVILWPTLVQGDKAAEQISYAITRFNQLAREGDVPRPDVLIVGRGGGSLEDLWCFNDENVVRAIASSEIPVISAVGHETDTTLSDFAADQRAPTPTAAAEMAVPVRAELRLEVSNKSRRMGAAVQRHLEKSQLGLRGAVRGLGKPSQLLEGPAQRLDRAAGSLGTTLAARVATARKAFDTASAGLRPAVMQSLIKHHTGRLNACEPRLQQAVMAVQTHAKARVLVCDKLLETLSFKGVLARGFALVTDEEGTPLRTKFAAGACKRGIVYFADGSLPAQFQSPANRGRQEKPDQDRQTPASSKSSVPKVPIAQRSLFD